MWIASTGSHQLVVVELWSLVVHREPPGGGSYSRRTNVATDGHVSKEEPVADEGLFGIARWLVHDVQVRRIEAECRGRQTVGNQVHPEQLDGDEGFGHAEGGRQEDADDFADVG